MNMGTKEEGDSLLTVGCLNTRSFCNKTSGVLELLKDNKIDVCCLTEHG